MKKQLLFMILLTALVLSTLASLSAFADSTSSNEMTDRKQETEITENAAILNPDQITISQSQASFEHTYLPVWLMALLNMLLGAGLAVFIILLVLRKKRVPPRPVPAADVKADQKDNMSSADKPMTRERWIETTKGGDPFLTQEKAEIKQWFSEPRDL